MVSKDDIKKLRIDKETTEIDGSGYEVEWVSKDLGFFLSKEVPSDRANQLHRDIDSLIREYIAEIGVTRDTFETIVGTLGSTLSYHLLRQFSTFGKSAAIQMSKAMIDGMADTAPQLWRD